jgi:hypothetical protein
MPKTAKAKIWLLRILGVKLLKSFLSTPFIEFQIKTSFLNLPSQSIDQISFSKNKKTPYLVNYFIFLK